MEKLLQDIKDTLEHIVASDEWETLKDISSADILIEEIEKVLQKIFKRINARAIIQNCPININNKYGDRYEKTNTKMAWYY